MHESTGSLPYRAFISYSHADRAWADWLHRQLESFRAPDHLLPKGSDRRCFVPVFKDREELASGSSLSDAVGRALDGSAALIVLCSPASARSRWVTQEVEHYRARHGSERIFCLVVDGDPGAAPGSDLDCFPAAVRLDAAGGMELEPLAADARPQGDGRQDAKLKLIAGLLGVGFDALKQRELQRRNRRLVFIAAASVCGMVLTTGLTVMTVVARQAAERERSVAERTTEFLVELFSVVDPSEARGRSVTAHEILEAGRRRIDSGLQDQPEVRARLKTTMGRVYTGLGLYDTAIELLEPIAGADDGLAQRIARGQALYLHSSYAEAATVFREALPEANDKIFAPSDWTPLISSGVGGLANTLIDLNQLPAAVALAQAAVDTDAAELGRESQAYASNLGVLAAALLFSGDLDSAEARFRDAIEAYRAVVGRDHPGSLNMASNLASVLYMKGEHERSLETYQRILPDCERVYGPEHPETAGLLNNIGRIQLLYGDLAGAHENLSRSMAVDRKLGRDGHDDLVYSLNSLAMTEQQRGATDRALALYKEGLELARVRDHEMAAPLAINLAGLECELGRAETARAHLQDQRVALENAFGPDSWRLGLLESVTGYCHADPEAGAELAQAGLTRLLAQWEQPVLYVRQARERLEAVQANASGGR